MVYAQETAVAGQMSRAAAFLDTEDGLLDDIRM
jgi:hypothetical protein